MWVERPGAEALSGLIGACIRHQFHRPVLARQLDFEEARLPFDADIFAVTEQFRAIVHATLLRLDLPRQFDPDAAARDVTAVIKGMIDTARMYGATTQGELAARVRRAKGILSLKSVGKERSLSLSGAAR